jgi:hypothetical protein
MVNDRQTHIREVFLRPVQCYTLREAGRLLGMSRRALIREAESDWRDDYRDGRRWRFTWRQAVCIALQRWTLAEIHAALGDDAARVLPPLLSLRAVTVQLPEFIVRALETIASEERTTLDAALHGELIDLAGTMADRMEAVAPGYRAAYFFPSQPQRQKGEQRHGRPN